MKKNLYPEIDAAGSLGNALNLVFEKMGSTLRVSVGERMSVYYARIEHGSKFSQVYVGEAEKCFLPDFWRDGVMLGQGNTDHIDLLAECLNFWLSGNCNTQDLAAKFSFVRPSPKAVVFDEGNEVAYTWNQILHDPSDNALKGFVALAVQDKILSALFPFISLNTLCFSRCTGYPYTTDTPTVSPVAIAQYLVQDHNGAIIGTGTASEALKMVLENLPDHIGPAVKGTSEGESAG